MKTIMKILVVDDQSDFRYMIAELLSKQSFLVETASSGTEALRLLSVERFHLVISDIEMPEGNGFWLAEQMTLAKITTPILLMTGGDFSQEQAKLLGALALLHKPFQTSTLLELIDDLSRNFSDVRSQRRSS